MRLFSIIIAVYNVENYLEECLDSVLSQSYTNWEAILVDDGSRDQSAFICDKYAAKDNRMRVFHRENEGSLMARRFGIYQAAGEYFLFIDSDDLLNQELLKDVNKIIEETSSDLVIYRFRRFGDIQKLESPIVFKEGTVIGEGGESKRLIWEKIISCCELNNLWLKVAKRECIDFEKNYEKYAYLKFGTDLIQSLAILDRANRIYFTEKIYYYYRYNESGISSSKVHDTNIENIKILMNTRRTLFESMLYFLRKNNCNTQENLQTLYIYYFKSKMTSLITWISNEREQINRKAIIQLALEEDTFLKEGIRYIKVDNIPKKYRKLYITSINNEEKKFSVCVCNHARIKRFVEWGITVFRIVEGKRQT